MRTSGFSSCNRTPNASGQARFLCRIAVAALLSVSAALADSPDPAVDLSRAVTFDIPGQPLESALFALCKQAHVQLLIAPDAASMTPAPALTGRFSTRAALDTLLRDTGLHYNASGSTISVTRTALDSADGSNAAQTQDRAVRLRPVASFAPGTESTSDSGSQGHGDLAEVIVTANKRQESEQNVAASVSVEKGEQLVASGQSQLADYAGNIPGLSVSSLGSPGQTSVSLRGISSVTSTPAIGVYLDDSPMGSSTGWANGSNTLLDMLPYDLDRLEVLRGPQGTLYGAGAMGGLIKYVLKTANTTQFQSEVGADVSTIDGAAGPGYAFRGRVNVPVVADVLGVSLSLFDKKTPGYMSDEYTGQRHTNDDDQYSGRLAALWTPAATLTVKLNVLLQQIEADDLAVKQFAGATPVTTSGQSLIVTPTNPLPNLKENFSFLAPFDERVHFYSATIDWNPGPVDVVSATSWSSQRSFYQFDYTQQLGSILDELGGTAPGLAKAVDFFGVDKFTEELRVASPQQGTIQWLAGLFDTHESSFNNQYIAAFDTNYQPTAPAYPPGLYSADIPEVFDEYAAFGELTWKIIDAFDITGGGRYAYNNQDFTLDQAPGPLVSESGSFHIKSHQGVFTWLGTAEYHFAPETMTYFRAASGYRPGGPNSAIAGVPPTVGSDRLINYELGLKTTTLDGRAQIDFDIYHIDWNDIQLESTAPSGVSYLANGGKAESQGVEFGGKYNPVRGLTFGLSAAFTDAHLTSVIPDASFLQAGYQLPNAPRYSGSLTADYNWPLMGNWVGRVGGAVRYVGWQWLGLVEAQSPSSTATVRAPGYSAMDLNAGVRDDHLNISLYIRNLTNKLAITGPSQQNLVAVNSASGAMTINTSFLQPRTVGVGVDYAF
jgi:iron complex outermembrane recepter protein